MPVLPLSASDMGVSSPGHVIRFAPGCNGSVSTGVLEGLGVFGGVAVVAGGWVGVVVGVLVGCPAGVVAGDVGVGVLAGGCCAWVGTDVGACVGTDVGVLAGGGFTGVGVAAGGCVLVGGVVGVLVGGWVGVFVGGGGGGAPPVPSSVAPKFVAQYQP